VHDFGAVSRINPEDLLLAIGQDSEFMEPLPRAKISIPKPILIAICLCLALVAAQEGWKWKRKRDALIAAALNAPLEEEPSSLAWGKALREWERTKAAPSNTGLKLVRDSLSTAPALWNGWVLKGATCNARDLMAPKAAAAEPSSNSQTNMVRPWSCTASYERTRTGVLSKDVTGQFPMKWNISFQPINSMVATWTVEEPVSPMKIDDLKTIASHRVDTVSQFQEVSPIISLDSAVSLTFAPVAIPPPKKSDGKAYPLDATIPMVQSTAVTMKAPFRSVESIAAVAMPMEWNTVALTVGKVTAGDTKSSINSSAIAVEITGVLYAKSN
jgi:hypothetical protein